MTIRQSQAKSSLISWEAKALWLGLVWKLSQSPNARARQGLGRTLTQDHIESRKRAMRRGRRVLDTMTSPGKMHQGDIVNGNEHEIANGNGIVIVIETGIVIGTENGIAIGTGTETETGIETGNASVIEKGNDHRAPKSILKYPHAPWRTMIQSTP